MPDTVYMFCAALHCADCIKPVLVDLVVAGGEPKEAAHAMRTAELCELANRQRGLAVGIATDTDRVPAGPFEDGGGESDSPEHCATCGRFLENALTAEGERALLERMADAVERGQISDTLAEQAAHYGLRFENAPRAAMADSPARFEQFLRLAGACHQGIAWARGKGLRQAWAECEDIGYMQWLLETFGVDYSDTRDLTEPEDYRGAFPDVVTLEPSPTFEPWRRVQGEEHYGLPVFEYDGERFAWASNAAQAKWAAELAMADSLWAFRSEFLADFVPALRNTRARAAFDKMREAVCEDANELVRAMVGDRLQALYDAAIAADGLGHVLATYDGEERETRGGLAFRID